MSGLDQFNGEDDTQDSFASKNAWLSPILGLATLACAVICLSLTIALWFGHTTGLFY
jgi:hypothetical protein